MFEKKSIFHIFALYFIAICFVILNLSQIRAIGIPKLIPLFDLMMVFYFAVFRKTFPLWFVFLLGLFNDSLNGNYLGVTSLCYIILIKFFSAIQRLMLRDEFKQIWQQFVQFCALFLLLKWFLLFILNDVKFSVATILLQFILSSSFYVVMHKFFDYLSEKLLD